MILIGYAVCAGCIIFGMVLMVLLEYLTDKYWWTWKKNESPWFEGMTKRKVEK